MNASYGRDDVMVRSDVERAFEEVLLRRGPEVFFAMLGADSRGWHDGAARYVPHPPPGSRSIYLTPTQLTNPPSALRTEISEMQSPPNQSSLTSTLRSALAEQAGCEVSAAVTGMWAILSSTGFDCVEGEMVGRVVRGEGVEGGMRRIF